MLAYLSIVFAVNTRLLINPLGRGNIITLTLSKRLENQTVYCGFSPIHSKNIASAEQIKLMGPDPKSYNNILIFVINKARWWPQPLFALYRCRYYYRDRCHLSAIYRRLCLGMYPA